MAYKRKTTKTKKTPPAPVVRPTRVVYEKWSGEIVTLDYEPEWLQTDRELRARNRENFKLVDFAVHALAEQKRLDMKLAAMQAHNIARIITHEV